MIHVVLASAHPTEDKARAALDPNLTTGTAYLGVWAMPVPEQTRVHVFATVTAEQLTAIGWTREERPA